MNIKKNPLHLGILCSNCGKSKLWKSKSKSFERSWGTWVKGTLPAEEQGKELHQTSETRQEKREWDKCFKC